MRKSIRAAVAGEKSRGYLKGSFKYRGVDGRVYKIEQNLPDTDPHLTEKKIERLKRNEKMSMLELFRMEIFLLDGSRNRNIKLREVDKKRLREEYPIYLNEEGNRYEGSLDEIWAILCKKFPERSARYPKGYKQAQYALRYGDNEVTLIQGG